MWFSAINVWIHFGVFDKNAKPSVSWSFPGGSGLYPLKKWYQLVWLSLLRQSPPSLWRLCLFGDSRSVPKMSLVLPVRCYPLSFIFEVVWTLSLKKSKHDLWISRLGAFSTPTCLLLPPQTPWKVKDFQLIYFKMFYLSR